MHIQAKFLGLLAVTMGAGLLTGCAQSGGLAGLARPGEPAEPAYKKPHVQEEAASMRSPIRDKPAPDFSLPDQDERPVTLQSLRGRWVVVYFYPKDDTPGCTCEATEFTKLLEDLRGMNAVVLGVSEDSPETHRLFIQTFKLGLTLLSDPTHEMMRRYGAWVDAYLGDMKYERMIRSTVLIDPEGIIRYHWPEVIPTGHAERVREKLVLLQAGKMSDQPRATPPAGQ